MILYFPQTGSKWPLRIWSSFDQLLFIFVFMHMGHPVWWVKSRSTFYICSAHIFSKDSEQRKVLSTLIKTLSLVFWFFWNFSVTFEMKQKSFAVVHVYSFLRPTPTVLDKIKRLLCLLSAAELLLWWWIIKKLK